MPYTPTDVRAPRLAGASLRAFAALVRTPGVGAAIRSQMLAQVGIEKLRKAPLGATSPERPRWDFDRPQGDAPDVAALIAASPQTPGFRFPSVADYGRAYRDGTTDPVKVARAFVDARKRADAQDPPLRAFIAVDEADLLGQAEAAAARLREGRALGPLDGVPIAVKDELDQTPYPTTVGTTFLGRAPAREDATPVARLRAAGALLVGKCNMHELGLGVTGLNPHHGAARNPYDPARATGGSSSGSAAAVASGLVPVAIGADGGGSIRIPAALCGMVGLKATWGRVSEHGAAPLCWSVAHVGPIGATVRDVAAVYATIAGPDPRDPGTLGQPPVLADLGDVRGLRLGIFRPYFEAADPDVVAACDAAVAALKDAGATVHEVDLPDPDLVRIAHLVTIVGEMQASRLGDDAPAYGIDNQLNFALASGLMAADFVQALRMRRKLWEDLAPVYERVDAVLTPTTGCTAPPVPTDALHTGESNLPLLDKIMRFAPAANLFGLPAISVPAGYDASGLPIGLQAMARPWEEHTLLRIAAAVERTVERRAPKVWLSPLSA